MMKLYFALIVIGVTVMAAAGCNGSVEVETETEIRYKTGVYTCQADGYHAAYPSGVPVAVRVEFSGDAITGVEITRHSETISRAAVNAALTQIPQSIVNLQSADVDSISGATYTSNAVINAVKSCVSQAARSGGGYETGLYTASAPGYHSMQNPGVPVKVRVDFSPGAITAVRVISHNESISREAVKNALTQIPQSIVNLQSADVDGVSGATLTSNAIITAVKSCISQAEVD
jgi:uncharacterized protein with FMN-binding domain